MDEEYLERPRRWLVGDIGRFMLYIGPISSLFDLATFALLWYVFGANAVDRQSLFQSGWFVEGLLSQTLIIHMIRTAKVPFLQSRAAAPLLSITLVIMAAGVVIPSYRIGAAIGMTPLPAAYFPWLVADLTGYCGPHAGRQAVVRAEVRVVAVTSPGLSSLDGSVRSTVESGVRSRC